MKREYIPNILTVFRILLTAPIVYALLTHHYTWAFYVLLVAGITDSIDGFLARHYHWSSRLGSALDPLADKILMVSVFLTLAYLEQVPLWFLGMVILREIVLVTGTIILRLVAGPYEIHPIWISKVNTFLQIVLTFLLCFNLSYPVIAANWLSYLMYLVFTTTLISMLAYMWIWSGQILGRREI